MKHSLDVSAAIAALAAIGLVGCSPTQVDEDSDDNRNVYMDGVTEPNTPAPPNVEMTCAYPKGTGVAQGDIVRLKDYQNPSGLMAWEGYGPNGIEPETFYISDFLDCDGSRGIHAVFITTSQYG